jgi:hypothetical protein
VVSCAGVFSKAGKLQDDQRKSVLDVTLERQLFAAFKHFHGSARMAFRCVLLSRPTTPPPHLTESDETMAVETRGGAEAYLETLGDVLGLGCQWADFA